MSSFDESQTRPSQLRVGVSSDESIVPWIPALLELFSEYFAPGTHTMELGLAGTMKRHVFKTSAIGPGIR